MLKITLIISFILVFSTAVFPASLILTPESQKTDQTCTIHVSAEGLVNAKGLDIEILWDEDIVECTSIYFEDSALTDFTRFYQKIENENGRLEIVLLKQSFGGYSGAADSFLVLTFETVSDGTTNVYIKKSYQEGDPVLVDAANRSIEAQVNTAVIISGADQPPAISATKLHQNYPNPFNPLTTIRFDVPSPSPVRLRIYDAGGRLIRTLLDGETYGIGSWEIQWDGKNKKETLVPSGIYFCLLEASGQKSSRKLVILR